MKPIPRRVFLAGAATAGGALVAGIAFLEREAEDAIPQGVHECLERFLSDRDGAAVLGEDHLRAEPALARTLVASLVPARDDPQAWFQRISDEDFARHVRALVRADFEAGRIAVVTGWVLARSEANLCALWACSLKARSPKSSTPKPRA